MQGSWWRRVRHTRLVEFVIETPYGQPIEAKTLGVVLAQVHQELGDRLRYDNAYHVRGEDEKVIISFEVEKVADEPAVRPLPEHASVLVKHPSGGSDYLIAATVADNANDTLLVRITADQVIEVAEQMSAELPSSQ